MPAFDFNDLDGNVSLMKTILYNKVLNSGFTTTLLSLRSTRTPVIYLFALSAFLVVQTSAATAQSTHEGAESSFWLWVFFGRLHPMIVHFPISLLWIALVMELMDRMRKSTAFDKAIDLMVVLGAISSVIAVAWGLILAATDEYGDSVLPLHKWAGIATMVLGLLSAFSYRYRLRFRRSMLSFSVLAVTVAGHYGAALTHGEDYLTSVMPFHKPPEMNITGLPVAARGASLSEEQLQELTLQVRTVLAHHCYKCHGRAKVKGELRLDTRESIMKGGEDGVVVVPGDANKSELIRRVTLPRNHEDAMPEKGDRLTTEEINVLRYWIDAGALWPAGPERSLYRVATLEPRLPDLPPAGKEHNLPIDRFVNEYFKKNNLDWREKINDRMYIRRVYLDVIGLLPPPDSITAFLDDHRTDKRELLVRRLLERNDDYAQQWITFWNDALRNDYSGTGYITGGRSDITRWLYTALRDNKPYNDFVRDLISPVKGAEGFIQGIKWRGTINASQRTEMQAAQNVAQVFLGLNIKCASCHDSFINDWKLDDAYAFANIFSDTILEINRCDKPTGRMAGRKLLFPELGEIDPEMVTEERLKQLADFLVQPRDGRLYRTVVNRVWAQLMGRGIVEPVDAMDNEPWSQDLLDWLASDFVANGFDLKALIYKIVTSDTYQLSSVGVEEESFIFAPAYVFNGMVRRRMTAEQFLDAVSQCIQPVYPDTLVVYSLLPVTLKDKLPFARAALVRNDRLQTALGRPNRETVSTSRSSQANLLQALELTNGSQFNGSIERAAEMWRQKYPVGKSLINEVYRRTLGRMPHEEEEKVAQQALGTSPSKEAIEDFIWAMTLHPEFQLIY
jgi:uncharacterized membrane protein/mono/diheme cytochrome c family protein